MTNKENLIEYLNKLKEEMNASAYDFACDRAASDHNYFCDAVAEFADNSCPIYYSDQRKYFYDHAEECENALLNLMDADSIADYIKKNGLDGLICYAGACGCYEKTTNEIYENQGDIIKYLACEYCLNTSQFLSIEQIEEIASNLQDLDFIDDIADAVNEAAKEGE